MPEAPTWAQLVAKGLIDKKHGDPERFSEPPQPANRHSEPTARTPVIIRTSQRMQRDNDRRRLLTEDISDSHLSDTAHHRADTWRLGNPPIYK